MRDCASKIKELTGDYQTIIEAMFKRLEGTNTKTNEWLGYSGDKFAEQAVENKDEYKSLGKELEKYATSLENTADAIERYMS